MFRVVKGYFIKHVEEMELLIDITILLLSLQQDRRENVGKMFACMAFDIPTVNMDGVTHVVSASYGAESLGNGGAVDDFFFIGHNTLKLG